jgi:hypothetical protein
MIKLCFSFFIILLTILISIKPVTNVLAASLSLFPSSGNFTVGSLMRVDIILNTESAPVHGVDVNALNYDKTKLHPIDQNPDVNGVQIKPGELLDTTVYNNIDTNAGKIVFSQVSSNGQKFNGTGLLASVFFNVLQTGTTTLTFDFLVGNTMDSNVASNGDDVLTSVINGFYTLNPSPSPIPNPAQSGGGGGGGGGGAPLITNPLPSPTPTPTPTPLPTPNPIPQIDKKYTQIPTAKLSDYNLRDGDMVSATGSSDPDIYIVNIYGYKRLFINPVIFNFYGHLGGWKNVKSVSSAIRDSFPTSQFFRNCETNDPKVYGLNITGEDTGTLHHIDMSGEQVLAEDPNFFKKVFCINNNEFNWYQKGLAIKSLFDLPVYSRNELILSSNPSPTPTPKPMPVSGFTRSAPLVKVSNSPTIYYVSLNGVKKPIPNLTIFYSYNNKMEDVKIIDEKELNLYPDYQGVIYNNDVYIIENGNIKRKVKDISTFNNLGLNWSRIIPINLVEFNYYTTGPEIQN